VSSGVLKEEEKEKKLIHAKASSCEIGGSSGTSPPQ
jgi:hypothetical protein